MQTPAAYKAVPPPMRKAHLLPMLRAGAAVAPLPCDAAARPQGSCPPSAAASSRRRVHATGQCS
eukprot:1962094-Pleurochrysis_carterae.AAC.2